MCCASLHRDWKIRSNEKEGSKGVANIIVLGTWERIWWREEKETTTVTSTEQLNHLLQNLISESFGPLIQLRQTRLMEPPSTV